MISRDNYFMVQEYLLHLREERQLDEGTIRVAWMSCRLLLEYADTRPLYDLADCRPTFPEHAATVKGKQTGRPLTARYQAKMLENVRHFFTWARMYKRGVWAKVSEAWIDNLRVRRSTLNAENEHKTHVFWDMGDIEKVASYKPQTLKEERTQAAILFMFLSGMRVTAFTSLPVDCVDLQEGRIEQKPSKGVLTKNRKAAVTFLLPIPELMPPVIAWDKKARKARSRLWFAMMDKDGRITEQETKDKTYQGRRGLFDGDLREFCQLVGVPVLSAHKLRHAHGVYGVRNARTMEELKAVSQNMMHANLGITDGIYGILPEENIKRVINTLSPRSTPPPKEAGEITPELLDIARMLLAQMKK